jgi:DNA or RNA helicases of superfamily II
MTIQLRPYQQQLVNEIRGQYQLGHRSVLAVLPTGAGKTIMFQPYRAICCQARQPRLYPVHRVAKEK